MYLCKANYGDMKHFLFFIGSLLILASCSKDDSNGEEQQELGPASKTVIVYMAAENSLTSYVQGDIDEMISGVKKIPANENLIVFVDRSSQTENPFIARITQDAESPIDTLAVYNHDFQCSDPDNFYSVLQWIVTNCPATQDYALVLWGHASGWIIEPNTTIRNAAPRHAYGIDNGNNNTNDNGLWLNIPDMRKALEKLPIKWRYIFFDCCNMQNVETAYELHLLTDYIIASPAEIPGKGAPYNTVVADLFSTSATFYQSIIDHYAEAYSNKVPLSVIKTNQMEQLANATQTILQEASTDIITKGTSNLIYYNTLQNGTYHVMFDVKDVVRRALANDETRYQSWYNALTQTVIYKRIATRWTTNSTININFDDFTVTDDNYSGISMFFPLNEYNNERHHLNNAIRQMQWYQAVGWSRLGW